MKIQMSKRKGGIYAQWFEVYGLNEKGKHCWFLIYPDQARNYAQAVRFWRKGWGDKCKAFYLRNAEPFDNTSATAC
jgi:hypothetical protein